jgi:3-hydroxyacyl-CoA dehydrogenase
MAPSALLDLVGLKVGAHVLDTHHAAFPDRFYRSENLHKLADYGKLLEKDDKGRVKGFDKGALKLVSGGKHARSAEEILVALQDGLAREAHLMLEDGVVGAPEDIDLCMVLGAGFPFQMGGLTPYLDRVGASERVFGDTFHHPVIRGVGA